MLSAAVATHSGRIRTNNEDRVLVGPWILSSRHSAIVTLSGVVLPTLIAVLDGMGGHAGGDVAAMIAADELAAFAGEPREDEVTAAVRRANDLVYQAAELEPGLSAMGTTIAGIAVSTEDTLIFNVGDARVYVDTDGYLLQASVDDGAPGRPGVLTQSLGGMATRTEVVPHLCREAFSNRRFLLATDGVFGHVEHEELVAAMSGKGDVEAVEGLVALALERGGPDNITLAIVRVVG